MKVNYLPNIRTFNIIDCPTMIARGRQRSSSLLTVMKDRQCFFMNCSKDQDFSTGRPPLICGILVTATWKASSTDSSWSDCLMYSRISMMRAGVISRSGTKGTLNTPFSLKDQCLI